MSVTAARVLLVEDSPTDAALLRESLSQSGVGEFDFTHAECWGRMVTPPPISLLSRAHPNDRCGALRRAHTGGADHAPSKTDRSV